LKKWSKLSSGGWKRSNRKKRSLRLHYPERSRGESGNHLAHDAGLDSAGLAKIQRDWHPVLYKRREVEEAIEGLMSHKNKKGGLK
jgi:hypothetical protein